MAYFLPYHSLSGEVIEQVTFSYLIKGLSHFPIFGKNSPQSNLTNI